MLSSTRLLLGSLGVLALLGCSDSGSDYNSYGPTSSYLVNAIAVADIDGNGLPDILGLVSTDLGGTPTQGYVSTRLQTSAGAFAMPVRFRRGQWSRQSGGGGCEWGWTPGSGRGQRR